MLRESTDQAVYFLAVLVYPSYQLDCELPHARWGLEVLAKEKMEEKVQYPAGSHIILNLKKVKEYGVEYNEEALASVNRIID